jgi:hypothetical protein
MAAAVMMPLTPDEDMRSHAPDGRAMAMWPQRLLRRTAGSRPSSGWRSTTGNTGFACWTRWRRTFPAARSGWRTRFEALSIGVSHGASEPVVYLRNLGSKLPEWLAANPKFAGRRQRLALDVARIEWAFVEAFDNAERTPLTLDQIATLDAGSRLGLAAASAPAGLDYAADDLVLALHKQQKRGTSEAGVKHEDGPEPPAKLPKPAPPADLGCGASLDNAVYYRRLEREEFLTLAAIRNGLSLGEALEAASVVPASRPRAARAGARVVWPLGRTGLDLCAPELDSLLNDA